MERSMATEQPPHPSPFPFHLVVTTTLPTEDQARAVAEAAARERLAACAQVQGPIQSTFHWQGAIDHATEWYCHCKTTRAAYPALERLIKSMHPYEVPEIIAAPIAVGYQPYLLWIEQEVRVRGT
jgi:periplasmic divalent cation tolerance protein